LNLVASARVEGDHLVDDLGVSLRRPHHVSPPEGDYRHQHPDDEMHDEPPAPRRCVRTLGRIIGGAENGAVRPALPGLAGGHAESPCAPSVLSETIVPCEGRALASCPGETNLSYRMICPSQGDYEPVTAPLRLMAVHAHPDDESSKRAATMARYGAQCVDVLVCTLTGGERGSILNPKMDRPEIRADISRVRREEMARAREILGVQQRFLGFIDSGLPESEDEPLPEGCFALQPLEVAARPLVAAVREFRPHVILTYDDDGGYPHPDHT